MSRASRVRAVTRAAAYGGGGLVGVTSAVFGLLVGEAWVARRMIGPATTAPLDADGRYLPSGEWAADQPIRLAVLGDSGAAGFGVADARHTTGAFLASGLAQVLGRPVLLRSFAVVGAKTSDVLGQVEQAQPWHPHVAVVIVGANDVTHAVTPGRSVAQLGLVVRRLKELPTEVVVGTCPDLGTVRPIPHPLRWVARRWSRGLAAAQMLSVVENGGTAVALADLLGEEFDAHPDVFFGSDRFHPSVTGYRALADVMVPSLAAVLDPEADEVPRHSAAAGRLGHEQLAVQAAEVAGAEVSMNPLRARLASWRLRPRSSTPLDPERDRSQSQA